MEHRGLRHHLLEGDRSLAARLRLQRLAEFRAAFPDLEQLRVVDLGGTVEFWVRALVQPRHVDVVNLEAQPEAGPSWVKVIEGDACELPPEVAAGDYDLVFSNSVIEHVGGHARRCQFAASIHALAPRHWVQTPNRYFPLEPHFLGPGFQFLPNAARARLIERWPLLHNPPVDHREAVSIALETELLGRTELAYYFPDSTIRVERIAGLAKSLIAVKQ